MNVEKWPMNVPKSNSPVIVSISGMNLDAAIINCYLKIIWTNKFATHCAIVVALAPMTPSTLFNDLAFEVIIDFGGLCSVKINFLLPANGTIKSTRINYSRGVHLLRLHLAMSRYNQLTLELSGRKKP